MDNSKKIKKLAKVYRQAKYNMENYGTYSICELTGGILAPENEDELIVAFERAVEKLKGYPFRDPQTAERYYMLVKKIYMGEKSCRVEDAAEELGVSSAAVYRYLTEAMKVIGHSVKSEEVEF